MTHNNVCHRLFFCDSRRTIIFSYRGRICITDPKKRVFAEIDSGKESKFFAEGYRWPDVKVFNERYSNDNRLKLNDLPSLNYSRNILDKRCFILYVSALGLVCSRMLLRATSEFYSCESCRFKREEIYWNFHLIMDHGL